MESSPASNPVRIRQVQPHETEHLNLLDELRHLTKTKAPEKVKIIAFLDIYRVRWWTCDRMRQYFQIITDDKTRAEFLDGETKSFKRCMDADSGNLNKLIDQIQSVELRAKIKNRIAEWENTSDARGAVQGIVKEEKIQARVEGDDSSNDDSEGSAGQENGADSSGFDNSEGGGRNGNESNDTNGKSPVSNILKKGRMKIKLKGLFRGKRWVQDTFRLEDHRPDGIVLAAKSTSRLPKIFLNNFDILLHDERNESAHYYFFRLTWNGEGTPPEKRVVDIGCKVEAERDEWVKVICEATGKEPQQPKLQTVADGSGKLFKIGKINISIGFMGSLVPEDCLLTCWSVEEVCCADGVSFKQSPRSRLIFLVFAF